MVNAKCLEFGPLTKYAAMFVVVIAVALVNCLLFIPPTPPGGVDWPYHLLLLFIPLAVYIWTDRRSVAICYGFSTGLLFAWPVFVDGRTALRAEYGLETFAGLVAKVLSFAVGVTLACLFAHWLRSTEERRHRRFYRRQESKANSAPEG